jgi:MFS family permease
MLFLGALLRGHSGAVGAPSGRFPRRPVAYRRRTLYGAEDRTTGRIYVSSTTVDLADTRTPTSLLRWYVLILTCFIYAINIADRYVVSTVLEQIRLDLHLTDSGVAILTGWPLAIFYGTFGIALSWLADRVNRRNILAVSLVVWSAFTAVCGITRSYWQFLFARVGVGIGEAGGTPPSTAIVSDYFPAERRPMAMTVLALGAPIGAYLGANFAGYVANLYTWRGAFLALGVPGLFVGILVYFTVREPQRGRLDALTDEITASFLTSLKFLWRQRAAFHVVIGGGLCALWGWGLMSWTPAFLQRAYGLNVAQAGAFTGNIHLIGGSTATVATAVILSLPSMANPRRVVWLLAAGIALATIPSIVAYWTHDQAICKAMFWIFIPAIYFYIGPCFGLLNNLAPCCMRNMFIAVSLLVANVLNWIVAPSMVGFLSDWYAGPHGSDAASLRFAMLILAPSGFWAAYHLWLASRTIVEDQQRAVGYTRSWAP